MKERITFVHAREDEFDPKQLQLQHDAVHLSSLKAAREDRLTLSLYELPQEIWRALKQCYELHLRWVSVKGYTARPPFVSKIPPGLHIFFTPQSNRPADLLCPLLRKTFGDSVACASPENDFIGLPVHSERFASSAAYQYFKPLSSLTNLVTYIKEKVCIGDALCASKAKRLLHADYFDLDFDAISQSVTLSAVWHRSPSSETWNETIKSAKGSTKVELGVLTNEKPTQPEELSLGGFLVVIGEDKKPNPTLFSFPSRHHLVEANFSIHFVQPTGLHPTLRVTLPRSLSPLSSECALHTYLTVPSYLFVDQYQLASPNYLASNNLHSIRSLTGETDLEAPDWAITKWGSALLMQLAPPTEAKNLKRLDFWHADIPMHLRYLQPSSISRNNPKLDSEPLSGHRVFSVPWPNVFWACPTDEGTKMNTNPFDRVHLGYDGLFGARTMFYHLQSASQGQPLIEELNVPTIDTSRVRWIELGTLFSIILGFSWVSWRILRAFWTDSGDRTIRGKKKDV